MKNKRQVEKQSKKKTEKESSEAKGFSVCICKPEEKEGYLFIQDWTKLSELSLSKTNRTSETDYSYETVHVQLASSWVSSS